MPNDTNTTVITNREEKTKNIEKITDIIQYAGTVPGPQQNYVKILTGHSGFAGSLANLVEKKGNGTVTKNDYIDVIGDAVTVVGAVAILAGGGGFIAGIAGAAIGAINFMDRNDWDFNKMKDSIKNGIDSIRGDEQSINNLNDNENKSLKDSLDALSYFFNPFDPRWQGKDPDWLEDIKDFWKNFFNPIADVTIYDPITLDLNNDSKISTLNLSDGVYFDHNGDKIAFKTSWIGKDDGILVFDKNNNGLIDNGNELFGNFTEISSNNSEISNSQISNNPNHNISLNQNNQNKQTSNSDSLNSQISSPKFAINGYHALSLQDSNNDGKIDSLDENFSNLKIWQDLNEDGISQSNELKTLDEHGIKSISLNFTKPTNSDILKDSSDIFKRQKFIQNLKKLTTSNQIITKKIYNFKSYKFAM
ncbi:hypothetical protein F1B92_08515 [Campylobacter sp. FMV-PI01]|uniref:Uncharacterized protein n=1 Tax=Campylobacter portucalensis TaxID=2608384 RepID=A0A6L5WJ58_9BACT|nr:hypothetical protein [Campylobacter portucalensis]MSN97199.1 hypothetical protein [Campylobacter portucalensis]